ncbi:hypothetical protein CH373_12430 [Leptospira perolatii]|uniref:Uncharacterized protein n=1 Tax=Leptospira perolatii TaxID=2023191 RepID=A0A2M9ZL91_9LEPT|nr:hypothetical protein CH360_06540 [Leptospira perolatii]PJZ72860.1 hypothetical protein CH373_12430 [Leptospira perolatii]
MYWEEIGVWEQKEEGKLKGKGGRGKELEIKCFGRPANDFAFAGVKRRFVKSQMNKRTNNPKTISPFRSIRLLLE